MDKDLKEIILDAVSISSTLQERRRILSIIEKYCLPKQIIRIKRAIDD
jgi:hypothetical protein